MPASRIDKQKPNRSKPNSGTKHKPPEYTNLLRVAVRHGLTYSNKRTVETRTQARRQARN
eukprot:6475983-Amphidinium_carterae.1